MTSLRIAAVTAAALLLTADPATAQAAMPVPPAKSCSAATGYRHCTTTVVIHVENCEMCVVTAVSNAPDPHHSETPEQWESLPVRNGRTAVSVSTALTRGLIFVISRPNGGAISANDAAPVVALGYRDVVPGTAVTAMRSARERSASPCWAGALKSLREVTVHFAHRSYPLPAGSARADSDHVDVFWASPTLPVVPGSWTSSDDGGLVTQDPNGCAP